jgi:hypothetical protein
MWIKIWLAVYVLCGLAIVAAGLPTVALVVGYLAWVAVGGAVIGTQVRRLHQRYQALAEHVAADEDAQLLNFLDQQYPNGLIHTMHNTRVRAPTWRAAIRGHMIARGQHLPEGVTILPPEG